MILRNTYAEISKSALLQNLDYIQKQHTYHGKKRSFFCPMIKANAYGHGGVMVAKILEPYSSHLGVVLVEEGLRLRDAGIRKPILVFGQFRTQEIFKLCVEKKLTPVISSMDQIHLLGEMNFENKILIHLKFDTGMSRLGFQSNEINKLKEKVLSLRFLQVEGICTHLLNSEDIDDPKGYSWNQIESLKNIEKEFEGLFRYSHSLSSGAILKLNHLKLNQLNLDHLNSLNLDSSDFFGARPGIAIYGFSGGTQTDSNLKPVMTLKTCVAQIRKIPKNQTVSYGATWSSPRMESVIATVGIGYGDGYFRAFSNLSEMEILNHPVPVVGRVCMDYCMLDITDHPMRDQILPGTEVIVFGTNHVTAETLAKKINTISYEVLSHVGSRVPRVEVV